MSALTLIERIKGIATFSSRIEPDSDLPAILADVRELERNDARYRRLRNAMSDHEWGKIWQIAMFKKGHGWALLSGDCLDEAVDSCGPQDPTYSAITKCAKEST
jgi:hypothetical protein